jgi:hypothetical protein
MRIPSGKIDQVIYFVAVDSTDLRTRETGLGSFTVYRSRNGAAPVIYTTPTVTELSAGNMPGVYALTIDEDTTIAAGSDSEEYCVHITQASMAPVSRTIELYRRAVTTGETVDTLAGGVSISVGGIDNLSFAAAAIDAAAIAPDAIGSSELAQSAAQEIADEVLDRDLVGGSSGNTRNVRNSLRAIRNKVSESAGTLTVTQEDDVTPAWTASVTRSAGTNPITTVDPA